MYRPAFRGRLRAGLDGKGKLVTLTARIAAQSLLARAVPQWVGKDGVDETTSEGLSTNQGRTSRPPGIVEFTHGRDETTGFRPVEECRNCG
jgi:hypothetical protein